MRNKIAFFGSYNILKKEILASIIKSNQKASTNITDKVWQIASANLIVRNLT